MGNGKSKEQGDEERGGGEREGNWPMSHISLFTGACFSDLSVLFSNISTILSLKHRSIFYANQLSSLSNVSLILNSVDASKMSYANLVQACLLIYKEEMVKIFFLSE